jgi:hypothetical protein
MKSHLENLVLSPIKGASKKHHPMIYYQRRTEKLNEDLIGKWPVYISEPRERFRALEVGS